MASVLCSIKQGCTDIDPDTSIKYRPDTMHQDSKSEPLNYAGKTTADYTLQQPDMNLLSFVAIFYLIIATKDETPTS